MNATHPIGTENATHDQLVAFFQSTPRKLTRAVKRAGVRPRKIGGEPRYGEDHVVQLAGPLSADDELSLRRSWRAFRKMPVFGDEELRTVFSQLKNLLESIQHYEAENKRLEHLITEQDRRIGVLEAARKPKQIEARLVKLELLTAERQAA